MNYRFFAIMAAVISAMCKLYLGEANAQPNPVSHPTMLPYVIVDTGQKNIFDNRGQLLKVPKPSEPFFGQDGFYQVNPPSYTLSSDGLTVYDANTGLTWQYSPAADGGSAPRQQDKLTWDQAQLRPAVLNTAKYGGYSDWRLPTIKELYSLIDFKGIDPSGMFGTDTSALKPFIDTRFFRFTYGHPGAGSRERIIDSQYASGTLYVYKSRRGSKLFGVNFADGRIKGYDLIQPGRMPPRFYVQCVRGNPRYGVNDFKANDDETISDRATGLMWSKEDSKKGMNWEEALAWVQAKNEGNYLGYHNWRLPTAKELQSIVDYARSPDTSKSAAINPLFTCTRITNEAGQFDYPCYWTGTTHGAGVGRAAVYIAFGRAMGYMMGTWQDVHGAGAQRSDPKAGNPSSFPLGRGPQGDAIRIYNYVRPVRNIDPKSVRLVEPDLIPLPVMRMAVGQDGVAEEHGGPEGGFHLMPRFAVEQMSLTPDQQERLAKLEKEVKAKLDKILTPAQQKVLDEARPPFPEGRGPPSGDWRGPSDGPGRGSPGGAGPSGR